MISAKNIFFMSASVCVNLCNFRNKQMLKKMYDGFKGHVLPSKSSRLGRGKD